MMSLSSLWTWSPSSTRAGTIGAQWPPAVYPLGHIRRRADRVVTQIFRRCRVIGKPSSRPQIQKLVRQLATHLMRRRFPTICLGAASVQISIRSASGQHRRHVVSSRRGDRCPALPSMVGQAPSENDKTWFLGFLVWFRVSASPRFHPIWRTSVSARSHADFLVSVTNQSYL